MTQRYVSLDRANVAVLFARCILFLLRYRSINSVKAVNVTTNHDNDNNDNSNTMFKANRLYKALQLDMDYLIMCAYHTVGPHIHFSRINNGV